MALIQSHTVLAEKIAEYKTHLNVKVSRTDNECGQSGLRELVNSVCRHLIEQSPSLVAEVAAGLQNREILDSLITETAHNQSIRAGLYRQQLITEVRNSILGYGPIQHLIDDPRVSDIDAAGPDDFTIKKNGRRSRIQVRFEDKQSYETFCRLLIIRQGGLINENDSHCRVTDAHNRLRINVTVPPRSLPYASLSIRKHPKSPPTLEDLKNAGMFDHACHNLLRKLASSGSSILVCGKGGSGKTTLLRALINAMPPLERIMIAESDTEIYPEKPCCLTHRIKRRNEGGEPVSLRDLISDGLTMSLDTYCIGEIVGDEAYEFIRAAYSGHRCLATIHAVSAEDALDRAVSLARPAAGGEDGEMLRQMLGKGIGVIIHLNDYHISRIIRIDKFNREDSDYDYSVIWQP